MLDTLRNLLAHQAWADASHWRALEACPPALDDPSIRERLFHIWQVERAFLRVFRGTPERPRDPAFSAPALLREEARRYHEEAGAFLSGPGASRLEETVTVPWLRDPPCRVRLAEALLQVVMHSQYHRGQNASRLRELGGQPPLTDWIVWLWQGRPAAAWA